MLPVMQLIHCGVRPLHASSSAILEVFDQQFVQGYYCRGVEKEVEKKQKEPFDKLPCLRVQDLRLK